MGGRLLQSDYESIVWLSAFLVMAIFVAIWLNPFVHSSKFLDVS